MSPADQALDAVVLGAAAMDMLAWVDRLPEKDGIVFAQRLEVQPGGSGANVAVALARLGYKTGFVANLSQDQNGQILARAFTDEGVEITACRFVDDKPTALCFIMIDRAGDRSMVALGGAGPIESVDDLNLAYLLDARMIYLTDISAPIVRIVADLARKHAIFLVLSPGGLISAKGLSYLQDLLSEPDLWLLSRSEALNLVPDSRPEAVPSFLRSRGTRGVVVTLGAEGAAYAGPDGTFGIPAVPASHVVDTTGAGDAFAAGLLAGILSGKSVEESLKYGSATASIKVGHAGARGGLPSMADVESLLAARTRK